jgi:hypothetical protein
MKILSHPNFQPDVRGQRETQFTAIFVWIIPGRNFSDLKFRPDQRQGSIGIFRVLRSFGNFFESKRVFANTWTSAILVELIGMASFQP